MHSLRSQGRQRTFIPYALFIANCSNNCSRPPLQSQLNQNIIKSNFSRHPPRDPGVVLLAKIAECGIWTLPSSCPMKDNRQQSRSLWTMRRQRWENSTHCPPQKLGRRVAFTIFFAVCTLCYPSFLLLSNINAGLAYTGKNVSLRIAASASVNQIFVSSSENKRKCVAVGNLLGGKHRKKKCCCVY